MTVSDLVSDPVALVAVMLAVNGLPTLVVGVPVITPVEAAITKFAGKPVADQVTGGVPVVDCVTW